jgi:hypothetical protein
MGSQDDEVHLILFGVLGDSLRRLSFQNLRPDDEAFLFEPSGDLFEVFLRLRSLLRLHLMPVILAKGQAASSGDFERLDDPDQYDIPYLTSFADGLDMGEHAFGQLGTIQRGYDFLVHISSLGSKILFPDKI